MNQRLPDAVPAPAGTGLDPALNNQHALDTPALKTVSTLEARGLRKQYRKRVVVSDVSLTVQSGEVVGLLGPNGAGKTTCFYMILGLVPIDRGTGTLDRGD